MKKNFHYISDLHLEFYVKFTNERKVVKFIEKLIADSANLPPSDTLFLVGDITPYAKQMKLVLQTFSKHYKNVIVVYGNHDYWLPSNTSKKKYKNNSFYKMAEVAGYVAELNTYNVLSHNQKRVILLNNRPLDIDGFKIYGTTYWYNVDENNQKEWEDLTNDSQHIKTDGLDFGAFHHVDMNTYNLYDENSFDIILSHFPPIHPQSSPFEYNQFYTVPTDKFIGKHWVFGHIHLIDEFELNGVNFYTNSYGYPHELKGMKGIKSFTVEK